MTSLSKENSPGLQPGFFDEPDISREDFAKMCEFIYLGDRYLSTYFKIEVDRVSFLIKKYYICSQ